MDLPLSANLTRKVSCRLYEDSRPHCLETSTLQKGLVLVLEGRELVEEGMGFGVPVVIFKDEPYFSSTSSCQFIDEDTQKTLMKTFCIDTVSRKRIGENTYLHDRFYKALHNSFHKIYAKNSFITPLLSKGIEFTKEFGINTQFIRETPRGKVVVRYSFCANLINVNVSLTGLDKDDCKQVVLLNEQGANYFKKYSDSLGLQLFKDQIEAWMPVKADEACLSDTEDMLGFSLAKVPGSVLMRGREKIPHRYSWVGLSYLVHPKHSEFSYSIKVNHCC